jgi:glycosyltransferase involved in cell wall biosynthesis
MPVSVIIPAYNEERHIATCIESLLKQECSDEIEIIVVNNASRDGTAKILSSYAVKYPEKIRVINLDRNLGPGGARNLAARIARGEILIFLDADMTFPPDFIEKLIRPIKEGSTKAATHAEEYVANLESPWVKVQGQHKRASNSGGGGEVFRAIIKEYFLKHGGFDPSLKYHDDRTFYYKTGTKALIVENTYCYHNNPDNPCEIFRRNFWIGRTLIAVSLIEKGWKGLIDSFRIILFRIIDLAAIPLFIYGVLRLLGGPDVIGIISILPMIAFIVAIIRSQVVNAKSSLERMMLKLTYAPAYRIIRAAGLIAGVIFSSRAKIEKIMK